jgi:hypothetical protein
MYVQHWRCKVITVGLAPGCVGKAGDSHSKLSFMPWWDGAVAIATTSGIEDRGFKFLIDFKM